MLNWLRLIEIAQTLIYFVFRTIISISFGDFRCFSTRRILPKLHDGVIAAPVANRIPVAVNAGEFVTHLSYCYLEIHMIGADN
jgi:hypothetical protein